MPKVLSRGCSVMVMFLMAGCGSGDAASGLSAPAATADTAPTPTPTPTPAPTPDPLSALSCSSPGIFAQGSVDTSVVGYSYKRFGADKSELTFLDPTASTCLIVSSGAENIFYSYGSVSASFVKSERDLAAYGAGPYARAGETLAVGFGTYRYSSKIDQHSMRYVTQARYTVSRDNVVLNGRSGTLATVYQSYLGEISNPANPLPISLVYSGVGDVDAAGARSPFLQSPEGYPFTVKNFTVTPLVQGAFDLRVSSYPDPTYDIRAIGTLDARNSLINGTLVDASGGMTGTFRGQLFGPDRDEIAMVFQIRRQSDGAVFFGEILLNRSS